MGFKLLRKPGPAPGPNSFLGSGVAPLCMLVLAGSFYLLLSSFDEWETASLALISDPPLQLVHPVTLLLARLGRAAVVLVSVAVIGLSAEGKTMEPEGPRSIKFNVTGLARFTTFTSWCWSMQGVYFCISAYCSAAHLYPGRLSPPPPAVHAATWVLYEVCLATSILVTVVVTFVLIPTAKRTDGHKQFFTWEPLLMHNANIAFMIAELLLTAIPVHPVHFSFAAILGVSYVIFSWFWFWSTGVFYYFFLDFRRKKAVLMQLALVVALVVFYGFGWAVCALSMSRPPWMTYPPTIALTLFVMCLRP